MSDTTNQNEKTSNIESMMGPTTEDSPPVSVPNESAPDKPETGDIIEPASAKPHADDEKIELEDRSDTELDDNANDDIAEDQPEPPKNFRQKVALAISAWWHNRRLRNASIAAVVVILGLLIAIPPTRYFMLNHVGVRASASITITDQSTSQPLKNVQVKLANQIGTTDTDGKVTLKYLVLGQTKLSITKRAFAEQTKTITVGWGSNPLGGVELKPVGTQYSFVLSDWLSGKPIEKAQANSGEFDAVSDKDGKLVLTVDAGRDDVLNAKIQAEHYRTETVELNPGRKDDQKLAMVSDRKQPFISKRSGKYDLFKIDVDGKNEELVLKGTGYEQPSIGLVPHPTNEVAALVSTRENVRNKDGFLLSTLTVVDLSDNSTNTIAQSERLQMLGWSGSRLVFAQVIAGASGGNPKRQRLFAYDYKTQDKKELASSNSFNDLVMIGNDVYYAPSTAFIPGATGGLIKIRVDGSNQQNVLNKEIWNIFRTDYSRLDLSVGQDWYGYTIGDNKASKQSNPPANMQNRSYTDSSYGKQSLWVEERDGKGTLLLYDVTNKSDKVLKSQSGLSGPVRWLDGHTLVYRIHNTNEIADYVLNIEGGEAKKIRDVTHTEGVDRWYYY